MHRLVRKGNYWRGRSFVVADLFIREYWQVPRSVDEIWLDLIKGDVEISTGEHAIVRVKLMNGRYEQRQVLWKFWDVVNRTGKVKVSVWYE